jgi:hypothetical protein
MTDILKITKEIEDRLWARYGDPLSKKTQSWDDSDRIQHTYYVSRLMEERGHKWVSPKNLNGAKEDSAYYSEKALQEAFEAGRMIAKAENLEMRKALKAEIKAELMNALEEF